MVEIDQESSIAEPWRPRIWFEPPKGPVFSEVSLGPFPSKLVGCVASKEEEEKESPP